MMPFVWGGAEELAAHLANECIKLGHESEILRIPFQWDPASLIPSQMLMVDALELWNVDRVIALKFPAYLIRHPHKTIWLLHQFRQAYDLFDAGQSHISNDAAGDDLRRIIKNADEEAFKTCRKIMTNSSVTQKRLHHYNHLHAEVVLPPLNDPELFMGGASQGYIFAGGRVNASKRQHLLVEAMHQTKNPVKLIIAGPPDSKADADHLHELVERYALKDRVKLDLRFLTRTELAHYVNHALACAYLPIDEDSLGYVTMEAAVAGKALLTVTDSGGILGLVKHWQTGWVASPHPNDIADKLTRLTHQTQETLQLGVHARALWTSLDINWPHTLTRLLR